MKILTFLSLLVNLSLVGLAESPLTLGLWPGSDKPFLCVFKADSSAGEAAPAVIVCPGGGYVQLCDTYEGVDMAKWLNARGIAAVVLNYRLAPQFHYPEILLDAQQAVRLVREHAAEWRIAPGKIGLMGFSAGGHLALNAALREKSRPDFLALVYPAVSLRQDLASEHFRQATLGPKYTQAQVDAYSGECQDCSKLPPTFVAHSVKDQIVTITNSLLFVERMRAAGRDVSLCELKSGLHGLGCGKGAEWEQWLAAFEAWLKKRGLASVSR